MVGIDQRVFGRAGKKVIGMMGQELVERVGCGDENRHCRVTPTTGPTRLLPRGSDGTGIANEQRCLQPSYINTQFEGVGGNHQPYASVTQTLFDSTALGRGIARPVTANGRQQWGNLGPVILLI